MERDVVCASTPGDERVNVFPGDDLTVVMSQQVLEDDAVRERQPFRPGDGSDGPDLEVAVGGGENPRRRFGVRQHASSVSYCLVGYRLDAT